MTAVVGCWWLATAWTPFRIVNAQQLQLSSRSAFTSDALPPSSFGRFESSDDAAPPMQEVEADCLVTLAVAEATDARLQVLAQLVSMLLQICRTTPPFSFTKVDSEFLFRCRAACPWR